jgi:hypothetical protein
MSYRQPWDIGHARVAELRYAAARERAYRDARGRSAAPMRATIALVARSFAVRLSRFADRLDARHARVVTTRPDGA